MWQLGCQIKLGKAGSRASLFAAISRHHLTGSYTHRHTQKCLFLFPADPTWDVHGLCSCLQSLPLPQMDTEANTVLWKWSHRETMQGSWPRGPGSRKSVCYSGGLTHDLSNTRPILTVSQVFIILWPLNISQTTTAQIKSCYHQLCTFFPLAFYRMISFLWCLNPPHFVDRWLVTGHFINTLHTVSIIVVVITHPFGFMLTTIHDLFQDSLKHKHVTSTKLSNK